MRQVTYSDEASRVLRRLPANLHRLIDEKVHQYAADPDSLRNNVKRLKGPEKVLRLRVGDWRVVFTENLVVVFVVRVAPRSSAYE